jgi:chromosome transmission fidelity protein 1
VKKLDSQSEDEDDRYLLDDYESDEENKPKPHGSGYIDSLGLSAETQKLLAKLGVGNAASAEEEDEPAGLGGPVVIYCSRTHSQLSQFSKELRRVKLPPVIDPDPGEKKQILGEELKHLTLGSRKNLCINPKVSKLNSATEITERCLEIQKPKASSDHKCPFVPNKENQTLVSQFRDYAISKIRDIEDLGNLGKKMGICPYYASRAALPISEVSCTITNRQLLIKPRS